MALLPKSAVPLQDKGRFPPPRRPFFVGSGSTGQTAFSGQSDGSVFVRNAKIRHYQKLLNEEKRKVIQKRFS